jgi:hypothetical protein
MSNKLLTTREERGKAIAKLENQIRRIGENIYEVLSPLSRFPSLKQRHKLARLTHQEKQAQTN